MKFNVFFVFLLTVIIGKVLYLEEGLVARLVSIQTEHFPNISKLLKKLFMFYISSSVLLSASCTSNKI